MRKTRLLLGAIVLTVIAGVAIFISCKKDVYTVNQKGMNEHHLIGDVEGGDFRIVTIQWRQHGCGHGKDKSCCGQDGSCWLWFHTGVKLIEDDNLFDTFGGYDAIAIVSNEDDDSGNIILDFKYQYNTAAKLGEFFDLTNYLFVIEDDIVETEDSDLLEIIGTTSPCTIPAGAYPVNMRADGIRVVLPVIY